MPMRRRLHLSDQARTVRREFECTLEHEGARFGHALAPVSLVPAVAL